MKSHASALEALNTLWASFIRLFGESRDMFVVLYVWNYLAPLFPFFSPEKEGETKSAPMGIYFLVKEIIEQGIREEIFDPSINGGTVSHMIITLFSHIADNSVRASSGAPPDAGHPYSVTGEIKNIFEIVLRGIAREGIDRSVLALSGLPEGGAAETVRGKAAARKAARKVFRKKIKRKRIRK
jgi:hypothetical protein